jgi:hypothetical protein
MKKKIRKSIFALLLVFCFFSVGVSFYFASRGIGSSRQTDASSGLISPTPSFSDELALAETYIEYVWYEDGYVKFEYPLQIEPIEVLCTIDCKASEYKWDEGK